MLDLSWRANVFGIGPSLISNEALFHLNATEEWLAALFNFTACVIKQSDVTSTLVHPRPDHKSGKIEWSSLHNRPLVEQSRRIRINVVVDVPFNKVKRFILRECCMQHTARLIRGFYSELFEWDIFIPFNEKYISHADCPLLHSCDVCFSGGYYYMHSIKSKTPPSSRKKLDFLEMIFYLCCGMFGFNEEDRWILCWFDVEKHTTAHNNV